MNKDDKTFKITDRRFFDNEGEVKDREVLEKEKSDQAQKAKETPKSTADEKTGANQKRPSQDKTKGRPGKHLNIDFATFVSSLHASAMVYFGMIPNPSDNQIHLDVETGKQNIDILEMLEAKTSGNLESDEAGLLENALYDLRIRYVELTKKND